MTKRAVIYARVSTDDQTVENQVEVLRAHAERQGWEVVQIISDDGISGSKGREDRPGYDTLCTMMASGEVDVIMAWSVDRLARTILMLAQLMEDAQKVGVGLYFHKQDMDTTTMNGRMMFGILSVFAAYEREMIRERVLAGQRRAKSQGVKFGPKVKWTPEQLKEAKRLKKQKMGVREIAAIIGVSKSTVSNMLNGG